MGISPLADCAGQVFVLHFPGVIERVIGGVPHQIAQRPGACQFALGMERPNGAAIGVAVRSQALVAQHRTLGSGHPKLSSPVLLHAQRMTDDVIPITPSPSRTHLASGPTRANARRRTTPSTPAAGSVPVPILRSIGLADRGW